MKLLRVFTVLFIAFHVTHCFRVRNPDRESGSIKYKAPIIGGKEAPEGSSPYHVSLQSLRGDHFCSGSIINSSWILTAAHCCLVEDDPSMIRISSGSNDLKGNNSYHSADKFFIHPYYNDPPMSNDIALIHLKSPIKWNEKTSPIEIETEPLLPGSKLLISGWGLTNLSSFDELPDHLQIAEVNYVPYEMCKAVFYDVDVGNICTFLTKGVGACSGDSGAPVVSKNDSTLVGIVNWGIPCAVGLPDVHVNVAFYHDWVQRTMRG